MPTRKEIIANAVRVLGQAQRDGVQVPDLSPELRVPDYDTANEIQARLADAFAPTGGWKVSAGGASGADKGVPQLIASPIPAFNLRTSGETLSLGERRNIYVEAEIAFLLGTAVEQWIDADSAPISACVQECRVAMEVVCSRFETGLATLPREHLTADLGGCAALFTGGPISLDVLQQPDAVQVALTAPDGSRQDRTGYSHDPLGLLAALVSERWARGTPLKAGQIVTTGAIAFAAGMRGSWTAAIGAATVEAVLA